MRTSGKAGRRVVSSRLSALLVVIAFAFAAFGPAAAKGGSHASHQSASASTLRGSNTNDRKGGRYLAPAAKKLPGKRKPPTLTLKRGKND